MNAIRVFQKKGFSFFSAPQLCWFPVSDSSGETRATGKHGCACLSLSTCFPEIITHWLFSIFFLQTCSTVFLIAAGSNLPLFQKLGHLSLFSTNSPAYKSCTYTLASSSEPNTPGEQVTNIWQTKGKSKKKYQKEEKGETKGCLFPQNWGQRSDTEGLVNKHSENMLHKVTHTHTRFICCSHTLAWSSAQLHLAKDTKRRREAIDGSLPVNWGHVVRDTGNDNRG